MPTRAQQHTGKPHRTRNQKQSFAVTWIGAILLLTAVALVMRWLNG